MEKEINEMASQSFILMLKIKAVEQQLVPLKEELDAIKTKLTRDMKTEGMEKLQLDKGTVTLVQPKDRATLDKEQIIDALGVENLDDYSKFTPVKSFTRITLKK